MKKGKMIIGALALVVALGAAFAFQAKALPGNLFYFNDDGLCVAAPCGTENEIGNICALTVYQDSECGTPYTETAYTKDGGK
jgi:hypothetical protein